MLYLKDLKKAEVTISKLKWKALDLLFPPFCCACGIIGYEICPACISNIERTSNYLVCDICGDLTIKGGICKECKNNRPVFAQLRSWGVYSGALKAAIHKLKFGRGLGIINNLINPITQFLSNWSINPNLILPVPLSSRRIRNRGYNQAELIAKPIASILGIDYFSKALYRILDTHSQVGLNAEERKKNLAGAFRADGAICSGKDILLIDDIATTGSTLNECAIALKAAGAGEVYCFTVARAISSTHLIESKINF